MSIKFNAPNPQFLHVMGVSRAVWLRRTVTASAAALSDAAVLSVEGEA